MYWLGATLHFLLWGRPPAESHYAAGDLGEILRRMLEQEPAERIPSAAEVAKSLERRAKGHDLGALAGGQSVPRSRRRIPRFVVGGITAVALSMSFAVTRESDSTPPLTGPTHPVNVVVVPVQPPPPKPGTLPMRPDEAQKLQAAWAAYLGQPVGAVGPTGLKTMLIPPGSFDLAPRYHVTITKPFRIGTTEVTRQQFQAFVTSAKYTPTADAGAILATFGVLVSPPKSTGNWREPGFPTTDDTPITHVSRADAVGFCEWLSATDGLKYRLPTEAEWRWAVRAGASTRYPFGENAKELSYYARYKSTSRGYPEAVGGLRPNAWGLFDMLGNVRVWVADGIGPYREGQFTDPIVPSRKGLFMLCGGDFAGRTDLAERQVGCDCSTLAGKHWYICGGDAGFRICREP